MRNYTPFWQRISEDLRSKDGTHTHTHTQLLFNFNVLLNIIINHFSNLLNCSSVPVNLRLLVYRYGMKNSGTEAKWNSMFQKYIDTSLAQEKDKLLYGLASVGNIELLYR